MARPGSGRPGSDTRGSRSGPKKTATAITMVRISIRVGRTRLRVLGGAAASRRNGNLEFK